MLPRSLVEIVLGATATAVFVPWIVAHFGVISHITAWRVDLFLAWFALAVAPSLFSERGGMATLARGVTSGTLIFVASWGVFAFVTNLGPLIGGLTWRRQLLAADERVRDREASSSGESNAAR